jgi:hypothetical protein
MKEHPILFSTGMVQAILESRKTQTRRVVNAEPETYDYFNIKGLNVPIEKMPRYCPYGQVGDKLWVRETFVLESDMEYYGDNKLPTDRPIQTIPDDGQWGEYHIIPHYRATEPEPNIVSEEQDDWDDRTRWKPSIFMPRWASRITLEITGIRVERLQDITEEDAVAEGVAPKLGKYITVTDETILKIKKSEALRNYKSLWNKINGKKHSWQSNPYVWVIEFRRLEC